MQFIWRSLDRVGNSKVRCRPPCNDGDDDDDDYDDDVDVIIMMVV